MKNLSIKTKMYLNMTISIFLLLVMIALIIILLMFAFQRKKRDYELMEKMEALILINEENPLPDNYHTTLMEYQDILVSDKMRLNLEAMESASCQNNTCLTFKKTSPKEEFTTVSFPSETQDESHLAHLEHMAGLAIDFYRDQDDSYNQAMWTWLQENAYRYGFIERYPKGKETQTGQEHIPWHYRFVGIKHATIMHDEDLCLEEYLENRKKEGI